jgi:hypothetical protein
MIINENKRSELFHSAVSIFGSTSKIPSIVQNEMDITEDMFREVVNNVKLEFIRKENELKKYKENAIQWIKLLKHELRLDK